MGAPVKNLNAADETSVEALLTSLRTIDPAERRRHASVFNYWLSIRGNRPFPAIRDLDPLEISDAGPSSVLMEMIGGGEDAEIRHLGHAIKDGVEASMISEVPAPSLLACIHARLPVVASSRQAFAFEDDFVTDDGSRRCWVTLLPLSANGTWIDFVYAFVSVEAAGAVRQEESADAGLEAASSADEVAEAFRVELGPLDDDDSPEANLGPDPEEVTDVEPESEPEAIAEVTEPELEPEPEPELEQEQNYAAEPEPAPGPAAEAGFSSKLLAGLASVSGFYGKVVQSQPAEPEYAAEPEPEPEIEPELEAETAEIAEVEEAEPAVDDFEPDVAEAIEPEPLPESTPEPMPEPQFDSEPEAQQAPASPVAMEASLQDKLTGVRAMAEEARQAQERSNYALYQGLGAAYDFALDAENEPEDYLRLVEAQGHKIQLRSPMKPVVKLAFSGLCDDGTIGQLEAVLAWALKNDLPRGSLADRIQAEGGIGRILAARNS